ncbi:hypothetical protein SEA_CEN1621_27 [Microbacterium phage Cen1621]|uniref:Uncharacterized protein n=1 Tax=Microbacterium phage Cen1621 TaxID=2965191 RepID=A0A9E7QBJ3_9CAUD|nr:hypothetical protein SEA_CEN1621_27 [Microbacterium phage Cen1621]
MTAARDHVIDARGTRVKVGDRIAVAVNSWNGPNLVIGTIEKITAKRTSVEVELHTSSWHDRFSIIDDSLQRFVKLGEEVPE